MKLEINKKNIREFLLSPVDKVKVTKIGDWQLLNKKISTSKYIVISKIKSSKKPGIENSEYQITLNADGKFTVLDKKNDLKVISETEDKEKWASAISCFSDKLNEPSTSNWAKNTSLAGVYGFFGVVTIDDDIGYENKNELCNVKSLWINRSKNSNTAEVTISFFNYNLMDKKTKTEPNFLLSLHETLKELKENGIEAWFTDQGRLACKIHIKTETQPKLIEASSAVFEIINAFEPISPPEIFREIKVMSEPFSIEKSVEIALSRIRYGDKSSVENLIKNLVDMNLDATTWKSFQRLVSYSLDSDTVSVFKLADAFYKAGSATDDRQTQKNRMMSALEILHSCFDRPEAAELRLKIWNSLFGFAASDKSIEPIMRFSNEHLLSLAPIFSTLNNEKLQLKQDLSNVTRQLQRAQAEHKPTAPLPHNTTIPFATRSSLNQSLKGSAENPTPK